MIAHLEARVRALHPALGSIRFTQEWGGPILFPESGRPFYCRRPRSPKALVVGGYSGHGVALSVYLGSLAAQVMLGRCRMPEWARAK
jgi:glycine/D-amino acid oxidase-like deaminating enzyme